MSPRPQKKASQLATALIEHSSDAIALLNEGGTVLYASPATARLLGRTIRDIMGTNVFKWVHEEDMETFTANFSRRLDQPGVAVRDEFRLRHSGWNRCCAASCSIKSSSFSPTRETRSW